MDEHREIVRAVEERVRQEEQSIGHGNGSDSGPSMDEILAALDMNEAGDGRLFARIFRDRLCFDAAAAEWLVFRGSSWAADFQDEALRGVDEVTALYGRVAKEIGHENGNAHRQKEIRRRIFHLNSVRRRSAVLTMARSGSGGLAVSGSEWDSNPWALAVENGVIDLKTGDLRPGIPSDYIRTVAPVAYNGLDVECPVFHQFLADVFAGDEEIVTFLNRLLGYGITGLSTEHVFPLFWGSQGRNGKSVLLEALKYTLGPYAAKARAEILLEQKYVPARGAADADSLALRGKRIVWAAEIAENRRLGTDRVKELCGGDTLSARAPFGRSPIEWRPSHLLLLLTNHKPGASAQDKALWSRIIVVPFRMRFVDDPQEENERKADPGLLEKLKAEASGILSWLVRGCLTWQREGLNPPASVKREVADYQKDEDVLGLFLGETCVFGADMIVQAQKLYEAYKAWAEPLGIRAMNMTMFGKRMKERFLHDELRGRIFYRGLDLAPAESRNDEVPF